MAINPKPKTVWKSSLVSFGGLLLSRNYRRSKERLLSRNVRRLTERLRSCNVRRLKEGNICRLSFACRLHKRNRLVEWIGAFGL